MKSSSFTRCVGLQRLVTNLRANHAQSNIIMEGFRSLRLGETVEFDVEDVDGGSRRST